MSRDVIHRLGVSYYRFFLNPGLQGQLRLHRVLRVHMEPAAVAVHKLHGCNVDGRRHSFRGSGLAMVVPVQDSAGCPRRSRVWMDGWPQFHGAQDGRPPGGPTDAPTLCSAPHLRGEQRECMGTRTLDNVVLRLSLGPYPLYRIQRCSHCFIQDSPARSSIKHLLDDFSMSFHKGAAV